jgi:hypothetical protein
LLDSIKGKGKEGEENSGVQSAKRKQILLSPELVTRESS